MTFGMRFTLVLLAAFFLASAVSSLAAWLSAGPVIRATARAAAAPRAWLLACVRLLPASVAIATTALVLAPGYYRHEQRGEPEGVGLILALAAAAGLLIAAGAVARAVAAVIRASALRRAWLAAGRPIDVAGTGMPAYAIDSAFPLVAVLGVLRPRLFISSSVLRACSPPQLAAIVEHERRHVAAWDNAVRLLMDAAPDAVGLTGASRALAAAWHQAAEHRADDAAARKIDLASALVRVARLASGTGPGVLPASALYRGEGLEERVRRLIDSDPDEPDMPRAVLWASAAALTIAIAAAATSPRVLELAHALLETAVTLP
ncbi:MAG TPA: M56 family metallopeptidase [Vicinamibacterales bacterium]|nr:M56 family metallopeptidase [Vicinamibacterales bacterium]